MPSVTDMSLIWNDVGSYLKGSSKDLEENDGANEEQSQEETENQNVTADCTKTKVKDSGENVEKIKRLTDSNNQHIRETVKSNLIDHHKVHIPGETFEKDDTDPKLPSAATSKQVSSPSKSNESSGRPYLKNISGDCSNNQNTNEKSISDVDIKIQIPRPKTLSLTQSNARPKMPTNSGTPTKDKSKVSNTKLDVPEKEQFAKSKEIVSSKSKEKDKNSENDQSDDTLPGLNKSEKEIQSKVRSSQKGANEKDDKNTAKEIAETSVRAHTPIQKGAVRDAVSASRSSSILGKKRASSKSIPRKVDYGKRTLSVADAEVETSEDESESDKEDDKSAITRAKKKEEKSTLKKRRKEYKVSCDDEKDTDEASDKLHSKDNKDFKKDEQFSNRKKSKGAKRKPTDLSRNLSQELDEIKRLKHGDLASDEDSSDTPGSHSDESDTDDDEEKNSSVHLLPAAKSVQDTIIKESVDEPDTLTYKQNNEANVILKPRPLNSDALFSSSILSAQPYNSVHSLTYTSPEHNKWQEEKEKVETDVKKEFNDVNKLREDQKKCMQRAKSLLKAAFSDSDSELDESENEGDNPLHRKSLNQDLSDSDVELT